MADIDIEVVTNIEGLDELEEAFTNGSKRAVRKFLRSVEMKATKPLVQSAKEFAPYETGRLEMDIHRQSVTGDGTLTMRVGPGKDAFYGQFQEFGAPEANVPAQHWLENAARASQDEVLEVYYSELSDALEEMKG
jgi:HK97 gp10 family phage protein